MLSKYDGLLMFWGRDLLPIHEAANAKRFNYSVIKYSNEQLLDSGNIVCTAKVLYRNYGLSTSKHTSWISNNTDRYFEEHSFPIIRKIYPYVSLKTRVELYCRYNIDMETGIYVPSPLAE